jgi:glycosyltransferase involved in cell wall biosynthesis
MIRISVVVCTYNRANLLARALESLAEQTLDKTLYEIIVVDNASTDNTGEVVRLFHDTHIVPNVLLVREDQLGSGYARKAGFGHARGAYVAFMDDDARADKDWLKCAMDCFECVKPTPFAIGGPILPFYDGPKPAWFRDEYEIRTWGKSPRFLKKEESFSGSNMVFRKDIIQKCALLDSPPIGMSGEYLSLGEDTILFERIWRSLGDSAVIYYRPEMSVFHWVPSYKMAVSYQLKRSFASGQVWYLRYADESLRGRLSFLAGSLISITKSSGFALLHRRAYPTYQNWIVERFAPIVGEIGRLAGCLGLFIPVRQRPR